MRSDEPPSDRKSFRVADGLYRMDQTIRVRGRQTGYDATGPYWIVGHIRLLSGRARFLVDGVLIPPPGRSFVMAMPPHSVVSVELIDAKTVNSAAFSRGLLPKNFPNEPIAFPAREFKGIRSIQDVERILRLRTNPVRISRCSRPHPLSERLKEQLGRNFQASTALSTLAKDYRTSLAALSRLFRRDWGKPPVQFRNWLRVMDAFRHLAEKTTVTDTAFDVGFNDLSRFHKQFKSTVGYTPLAIRKRSKNAKYSER
ncbi:MAG: AraC family transcriptional regulator [Elusimicrobia bacterium]|nr:AraC family transcriptional regulator [Elusimicrobiota bacterium]